VRRSGHARASPPGCVAVGGPIWAEHAWAIVIATAAHRRAFEAHLRRAGVDLVAAAASDAYLVLDAEETLTVALSAR
jgi:hypothetical protein